MQVSIKSPIFLRFLARLKPCPCYKARFMQPVLVVFWGDANRDYFATMLLPSLLAPGNLAAVKDVAGSKLVCTTRYDWNLLQELPLFKQSKALVELLHIEIPFPSASTNKYGHASYAFKRAIDLCWKDRACASLLSPDVILADGTLAFLRGKVERGVEAVLAPALRFDMEKCVADLKAPGTMNPTARSWYRQAR